LYLEKVKRAKGFGEGMKRRLDVAFIPESPEEIEVLRIRTQNSIRKKGRDMSADTAGRAVGTESSCSTEASPECRPSGPYRALAPWRALHADTSSTNVHAGLFDGRIAGHPSPSLSP